MIVATAGHVDHGKTSLVRALTGVDTDRLAEEKARGLSIELGFAYHDPGDGEPIGFVDVPGHERFVRTMVAGVGGIDAALLVVAADDGPMPQTEEHVAILDLLGVSRGIVALTKADRADAARIGEVAGEIRALLAPTGLAVSSCIPVATPTGEGIETLRAALRELRATLPARRESGNFRLAVDRSFLLKGVGRIATGTVYSGSIAVGDPVHVAPGSGELRVRAIHAHDRAAETARVGQRCALNLAGAALREREVGRGDWLVGAGACFGTRRLEAELRLLAGEPRALGARTPVHVHLGADHATGHVTPLAGTIAPGARGLVRITLERAMHAVHGDRFVLRDQSASRTIGGGLVLDPLAPELRARERPARVRYLASVRAGDPLGALRAALDITPDGVDLSRFAQSFNLRPDEADVLWSRAGLATYGPATAPIGVDRARWEALEETLVRTLAARHAAMPTQAGVRPDELRRALPEAVGAPLFRALVHAAVAARRVVHTGGLLRLPDHVPRRDPADETLWERVRPLLAVPDLRVPLAHELQAPLGLDFPTIDTFLRRSAREGYLAQVGPRRYLLPEAIEALARAARELAAQSADGTFSAAEFRDRVALGRNAVIEILEYFDRIGFTRRCGPVRVLLREAP